MFLSADLSIDLSIGHQITSSEDHQIDRQITTSRDREIPPTVHSTTTAVPLTVTMSMLPLLPTVS
jgi:hypothetical protein